MMEEVEAARRLKTEQSDRMHIEDQGPRPSAIEGLRNSFEESETSDDTDGEASLRDSEVKSQASSH